MRRAQRALADFLPLIDWPRFRRVNLNEEVEIASAEIAASPAVTTARPFCGCCARMRAVETACCRQDAKPTSPHVRIPGSARDATRTARTHARAWRSVRRRWTAAAHGLSIGVPPFVADVALAIRRA